MTKNLRVLSLVLPLSLLAPFASAADAPPPPGMAELFFCTYNEGNDRSDLLATRDYIAKELDKADIPIRPSFVWHKVKGSSPADFIWLTFHESPMTYGAAMDAQLGDPTMAKIFERFGEMADCNPGLATARPMVQREPDYGNPPYIHAMACNTNDGVTTDHLIDLRDHYQEVFNGVEGLDDVTVFGMRPITGRDAPDAVIVSVHKSAADWAENVGHIVNSAEGQSLIRHRQALMACDAGHWRGEPMLLPES